MGRKKSALPSSYTIIFSVIVFIAILTQFISGIKAATLANVLSAPILGFGKGVKVILFILIIGGFIKIVNSTKVLENGISLVVQKLKGREIFIIPLVMFLISLGGTTYGMAEETLALYPILLGTFLLCGYDILTGLATILCGVICGVSGSTINPFSISTAIEAFTGSSGVAINQALIIMMGGFVWISSFVICSIYVMNYAKKVQKNPQLSLMSEGEKKIGWEEYGNTEAVNQKIELGEHGKSTLLLFGLSFLIMVIALIPWKVYGIKFFVGWSSLLTGKALGDWGFNDLSVWFLVMAVIIAKVNGLKEKEIVKKFLAGAAEMISVAMILGVSRGVAGIMATTGFDKYLLKVGMGALSGVPSSIFAPGSYLLYSGFTFLIPSTSGLATATIPTMAGLAHSLGFRPEVMISIYIGAHFMVGIIPTSGVVMGSLSISHIEFGTWLKFFIKPFALIGVINMVFFSIMLSVL